MINIISLQETQEPCCLIAGYNLITFLHHPKHSFAAGIKHSIEDYDMIVARSNSGTFTISIRIGMIRVFKVCKSLNTDWSSPHYPVCLLAIYLIDFSSHHAMWSYVNNDTMGEALVELLSNEGTCLLFDAKDGHFSFCPLEQRLQFITKDQFGFPQNTSRTILVNFPYI